MENATEPREQETEDILLAEEEMAPQVICFNAEGKAELVKLAI